MASLEGSSIDVFLELNLRVKDTSISTEHKLHVVLDGASSPARSRQKLFSSVAGKLQSQQQLPEAWHEKATFTAGGSGALVSPTHALRVAQCALRNPAAVASALHGAVSKQQGSDVAEVKLRGELDISSAKGSKRKRLSDESDAGTVAKKVKVKVEGKSSTGNSSEATAARAASRGDAATTQVQKAYSRIGLLLPETNDALAKFPSRAEAAASGVFKRKLKVGENATQARMNRYLASSHAKTCRKAVSNYQRLSGHTALLRSSFKSQPPILQPPILQATASASDAPPLEEEKLTHASAAQKAFRELGQAGYFAQYSVIASHDLELRADLPLGMVALLHLHTLITLGRLDIEMDYNKALGVILR